MHASIQVTATELAPAARGAAMSLHSFSFFMGHASGPVLYSLGFVKLGAAVTLTDQRDDRDGRRDRVPRGCCASGRRRVAAANLNAM